MQGGIPTILLMLACAVGQVGNASTVLGFVGAPFTLASYIVEGGSSKNFAHIKKMAFSAPEVLHALNTKLAESIADYVRYQVCLPGRWSVHLSFWAMGRCDKSEARAVAMISSQLRRRVCQPRNCICFTPC